ncbi:MAG: hypothetical protein RI883_1588 [Bacteroidota bacterium]
MNPFISGKLLLINLNMIKIICFLIFILPICSVGQAPNSWLKKNDFGGLKRERAVAFSIGDFGYVGTGVDTVEVVHNDFWKYDAVLDTWTQIANLPGLARRDAVAFAIGGKGYVGTGIDNDESALGIKLNDFWEYDPSSNSWLQVANYPGGGGAGMYFATAFAVDSKGYVCGGKSGPSFYSSEMWEYKPSINQWTQRASFPGGARYQLASFSIGYYGYVGLGANEDIYKKDFWKYNAGTNQWIQITDLPASERGACCTFTIGERGFVCMGSDGGILDDLWEFNPNTNDWTSKAPYGGSERKNAVAFVINDKAYVGTGKGYSGKKAGMEEYIPSLILGMNELSNINFTVYPNPSQNSFHIVSLSENIDSYSIYSTSGKLIKEVTNQFNTILKIDHSEIEAGIYFLKAKDKTKSVLNTQQIILL